MTTDPLFQDDPYLDHCQATIVAAEGRQIRLNRTVFYAAGGGQPGDVGSLIFDDGRELEIVDTLKGEMPGDIIHVLDEEARTPKVGETVTAALAWDRRLAHMRMHTCLHLVCSLIEGDVTGGQIASDRGRLDFALAEGARPDRDALTAALNRLIAQDHAVTTEWITAEALADAPHLVRTMKVKPPTTGGRVRLVRIGQTVDLQPCGGTHVRSTAEIGPVAFAKIENKGRQNKRFTITFE